MLGFIPVASAPITVLALAAEVFIASQSMAITPNSVAATTDASTSVEVSSQTIATTLSSVSADATTNADVASQTISSTLNNVQASTASTVIVNLDSQILSVSLHGSGFYTADNASIAALPIATIPSPAPTVDFFVVNVGSTVPLTSSTISLALNDVAIGAGTSAAISSQTVTSTLNSATVGLGDSVLLDSQTLNFNVNNVGIQIGVEPLVTSNTITAYLNDVRVSPDAIVYLQSQTIYTTLNGFRLWQNVDTIQPAGCYGYTPGVWQSIESTDYVFGDNFAVAGTPIATLPQPLTPIKKTPATSWGAVATTTPTTWTDIQT